MGPFDQSWVHNFFRTIAMMKFVLKNPYQQLCIELFPSHFHGFMSGGKPVQSTNFCPCMSHCPTFEHRLTNLGHTVFWDNRIAAICPEKLVPTAPQSLLKSLIKVRTLNKGFGVWPKIIVLETLIKGSGFLARSLK